MNQQHSFLQRGTGGDSTEGRVGLSDSAVAVCCLLEDGGDLINGAAFGLRNLEPREEDEQDEQHHEYDEHEGTHQLFRERKREERFSLWCW